MLQGKRILLGITGGIAAYKTPALVRLLVKSGAEVQVVLTPSAKDFVSDLVLGTLSGKPALCDYLSSEGGSSSWNNHVELGLWADLMLIAPLTANSLSKMVNGLADELLWATYLSARCPVMVSPAMDLDMYAHPSTKRNLAQLERDGVRVIPAATGELASGLTGQGRMPEPEDLLKEIEVHFKSSSSLAGKRVLINAGPTYEPIDPVRFIGNHSSGKTGVALAKEALSRGAQVDLVLGPVAKSLSVHGATRYDVMTAEEMNDRCQELFPYCDIAILSAAVSDYRPASMHEQKIKKGSTDLEMKLEPTVDILKGLGERKAHQFLVGFALETTDAEAYGRQKLKRKNLDLIIVNSPGTNTGFGTDTNKVILLDEQGGRDETELLSKSELAKLIFNRIEELAHV